MSYRLNALRPCQDPLRKARRRRARSHASSLSLPTGWQPISGARRRCRACLWLRSVLPATPVPRQLFRVRTAWSQYAGQSRRQSSVPSTGRSMRKGCGGQACGVETVGAGHAESPKSRRSALAELLVDCVEPAVASFAKEDSLSSAVVPSPSVFRVIFDRRGAKSRSSRVGVAPKWPILTTYVRLAPSQLTRTGASLHLPTDQPKHPSEPLIGRPQCGRNATFWPTVAKVMKWRKPVIPTRNQS
jgi:hypothetical protein